MMNGTIIPEETSFHQETEDLRRLGEGIVLAGDDDDNDDDDDLQVHTMDVDEDVFDPLATSTNRRLSLMNKSKTTKTKPTNLPFSSSSQRRRRRRSSARFLRMSPDEEENKDNLNDTTNDTIIENLGEVYQKAIRMNAENRINAANSWNLNLIDHLDRFVAPELRTQTSLTMEDTLSAATGVNFTKASCTLDASVKIYSYRVDDVHLTSYKVLANLNRTDNHNSSKKDTDSHAKNKKKQGNGGGADNDDDDEAENGSSNKNKSKGTSLGTQGDTLEHNLGNINIHKLDAAFDIDPLFHKMSKTFDEGGAKGLLLANLGVSYQGTAGGCKIVFDSSLDDQDGDADTENQHNNTENDTNNLETSKVDISSLVAKIESLVGSSNISMSLGGREPSVNDLPLVPQLAILRHQFADLERDGFVDQQTVSTKRYATTEEEEAEADKSIHLEAIERSRASQGDRGRSLLAQEDSSERDSLGISKDDYEADDIGGGVDFADDNDARFATFHDGDHRFSSESFQGTASVDGGRNSSDANQQPSFSQTTQLLDAIASGDIAMSLSDNSYEYFNTQAMANLSSGNLWAGVDHWKKMGKKRKVGNAANKDANKKGDSTSPTKTKKKAAKKGKSASTDRKNDLVDISKPIENLKELLKKPKSTKRGGGLSSKLQWTKAAEAKYENNDNLLPKDAGLSVKEFSKLFLHPNANLVDFVKKKEVPCNPKVVGFGGVETWGGDNNYDEPDDDGGFGFDFGGQNDPYHEAPEDFIVPSLEGVRKVEKIKVGYATVAKKVDVKRLKQDLWEELERTFKQCHATGSAEYPNIDPLETQLMVDQDQAAMPDSYDIAQGAISFQDTVRDMQAAQSQADVTLSFYFICVLHLCNEKGITLESRGLNDFVIHNSSAV